MAPYRFVVVALLIGGVVAPAASQALATYDDFAGPAIDPARWRGYEHVVPGTHWRRWRTSEFVDGPAHPDEAAWYAQNTERRREIVGGRLHLGLTTWGMRDPYPGDWKTKPKGRIGVRLADVALADGRPPIRTMAADVTLTSVKTISTCDEATPKGGAGILGAFFNDGSSGSRDSRVGDIVVSLTASAAPGSDDVTVGGEIKRCIAEDCSAIEHLTGRAFDLTWPRGTRLTLRIAWQPEQSRFRLSVRGGDRSDTLFLTYP